jgi:tRNA U34 5-methylaminomethyl-2-thiouridine-forming methyltransferase MnmC
MVAPHSGIGQMNTGFQHPDLDWRDGVVPVARRFDDPYFSLGGGLAETQHVFLAGNNLPARFRPGFRIAELGFGTGLNMLAALMAWREAGIAGPLHFTSFEAYPLPLDDTRRALAAFPQALAIAEPLFDQWASGRIMADDINVQVIFGDARLTLPVWQGRADAWFLDGFSPAKNPEMWGEPLMMAVAAHTAAAGTLATYTAAGHVRRALSEAGFAVTRQAGFGTKRHMTTGILR